MKVYLRLETVEKFKDTLFALTGDDSVETWQVYKEKSILVVSLLKGSVDVASTDSIKNSYLELTLDELKDQLG